MDLLCNLIFSLKGPSCKYCVVVSYFGVACDFSWNFLDSFICRYLLVRLFFSINSYINGRASLLNNFTYTQIPIFPRQLQIPIYEMELFFTPFPSYRTPHCTISSIFGHRLLHENIIDRKIGKIELEKVKKEMPFCPKQIFFFFLNELLNYQDPKRSLSRVVSPERNS